MRMQKRNNPYTPLNFSEIERLAKRLANIIETRLEELTDVLLRYESYEVVQDEVARTLDLLKNIRENKKYFQLRIGAVTTFLPRNQPLYAFTCFVVVPSLMASEVHFRIPHSMKGFFPEMVKILKISKLFPNIIISHKERLDFLKARSAFLVNPSTKESKPLTDVVIFTGTPTHADRLRLVFDRRTLFIANGAGHNPVVISKDADLSKAVEAVMTLQFYNQGQDCAAPNAILVHKSIAADFLHMLRQNIRSIKIGDYKDKSCRIGPISDPNDLVRIQDFLTNNREWLDPFTTGIIRTRESIVEPTIIYKPLIYGGNYREIFAPIIFVQEYSSDKELKLYFENNEYVQNAMYVILYGNSTYVRKLFTKKILGKVWHDKSTFIHNKHLHALGVERGTQPYGGFGYGASSVSLNGKIIPKPTLPQRDIYEFIQKPLLKNKKYKLYKSKIVRFTKLEEKDVEKLLRIKLYNQENKNERRNVNSQIYYDFNVEKSHKRFKKIYRKNIVRLLDKPNTEYIKDLQQSDISSIRELKKILKNKSNLTESELGSIIYNISQKVAKKGIDSTNQRLFFSHIYQLLLGTKSGPKLAPFLLEIENKVIERLLDV